jgi:NAD(P)-dependent dehydrogenase (short-subunit alcohol dehydrogenase family)
VTTPSLVPERFAGRVALVTGAASGIGRATALRLAAEGADVLAHDVAADGLATLADEAKGLDGAVTTRAGDLSDPAECRAAVAACVAAHGRLDVLANVAGIARADHLAEVDEPAYRRMMAVNVDAPFFLCQAALPHLRESGGNVVNIASNAGLTGTAYTVVYSMTKGAVVQLTRSLAMELLKTPVRVNAIAPGMVSTALVHGFQMPGDVDGDLVGRYMSPRPMATPDDIAALLAFVASDDGRNVHGAILSSDAGLTAG